MLLAKDAAYLASEDKYDFMSKYADAFCNNVCPVPTMNVCASFPPTVKPSPKSMWLSGLPVKSTTAPISSVSYPGSYQVSPLSMLYQSPNSVPANNTLSPVPPLVKTCKS